MTETSRFWDGVATGDATVAPYDAPTEFADVLQTLAQTHDTPDQGGVIRDNLSDLSISSPGANTQRVASGRAMVYGNWYYNDGNVDVTIPTPSSSTRIDRIVLRKSWSAQTVRVTRIAGVEGGSAPALVQNAGVTWDVRLYQVSITTGGTMTVTDERTFVHGLYGAGVRMDSTGAVTFNGNTVGIVSTGNPVLRLTAGAGALSRVIAADNVGDAGYLDYDHSADAWSFKTNGTERLLLFGGGAIFGDATGSLAGANTEAQVYSSLVAGLSMASARADADDAGVGQLDYMYATNSVNHKRIASIIGVSDGATANQRGGKIEFWTKPNASTTLTKQMSLASTGVLNVCASTATPANGSQTARLLFGTTSGFGIYYGSGAPTVGAAQGSIYLRSDGASTSTRLYVNSDGATTWTGVTTVG